MKCGHFTFSAAHGICEYKNMGPKTFNVAFYDPIRAWSFWQVLLHKVRVLRWTA